MDWNFVVHALDELRDGPRPLLDLPNILSRFDRVSCVQTLSYLADRDLIRLSAARYPFDRIPKEEWTQLLRSAFASGRSDPAAMAQTTIELSERGEQVLKLFGIGHP